MIANAQQAVVDRGKSRGDTFRQAEIADQARTLGKLRAVLCGFCHAIRIETVKLSDSLRVAVVEIPPPTPNVKF